MVADNNITVVRVAQPTHHAHHDKPLQIRQRQEPLQIIDEDLEQFFEKQGCIIQRTFIDITTDSNSYNDNSCTKTISNNITNASSTNDSHGEITDDIITEQIARITLTDDKIVNTDDTEVTVNKGYIIDQNVGVSGEVFMVSLCSTNEHLVSTTQNTSSSKRFPTIVYIGTIEEKENDQVIKSVDIVQTINENDSGPSSITLSIYENSPPLARKRQIESNSDQHHKPENPINVDQHAFSNEKPLLSPALLLQWRVRPPEEEIRQDDRDPILTPSSSMFSSAYTVTELGSDNNSDHSPPSESCSSTMSSRRTSEMDDVVGRQHDSYLKFQEYLHLFRQLTAFNNALIVDGPEHHNLSSTTDDSDFNLESREGSNKSIVFNYIPSRDQREREEEELWVANEATYSYARNCDENNNRTNETKDKIDSTHIIIKTLGCKENSPISSKKSSEVGSVEMTTSATQTVYSCLPSPISGKDPISQHSEKHEQVGAGPSTPSVLATLPSTVDECCSPSHMAALLYSANTTERRHFSARQRLVEKETQINTKKSPIQSNDKFPESTDSDASAVGSITSAATNQPTKRFSFLIRNNSIEQNDRLKMNISASASDKAILAKLAELKLEDTKENISEKKQSSSASVHPACRRCHDPVYPQERIQPSKDIIFHTSCFKCYQCGVRLNLKTFYRNPLTLRDDRIFCKSHVPSLDPVKVSKENKTTVTPKIESAVRSCRTTVTTNLPYSIGTVTTERVVIKGDTQGLRYF